MGNFSSDAPKEAEAPFSSPNAFSEIAPWYDDLMAGVPYESWVGYLQELLELYHIKVHKVLDLACGTGRFSRLLRRLGWEVVGVDASPAMIQEAQQRSLGWGIRYYCQKMQDLSLEEEFDLVVCLFDSLNYVLNPEEVQGAFHRVYHHLRPGGAFIFDVNDEYAYRMDLFTQRGVTRSRRLEYIWKSRYDPERRLCRVDMRFIVRYNGITREFQEVHYQRYYPREDLQRFLEVAGFKVLAQYQAWTLAPPTKNTDRTYFVAQKPG